VYVCGYLCICARVSNTEHGCRTRSEQMHTCACVHACVIYNKCACVSACTCACVRVCMCMCVHACVRTCACVCVWKVCVCIRVCVFVCLYVCIRVCGYVRVHACVWGGGFMRVILKKDPKKRTPAKRYSMNKCCTMPSAIVKYVASDLCFKKTNYVRFMCDMNRPCA